MSSHHKVHLRQRTPPARADRVILDVPRELVRCVSGLLAAERRGIGTRKGTRARRAARLNLVTGGAGNVGANVVRELQMDTQSGARARVGEGHGRRQ